MPRVKHCDITAASSLFHIIWILPQPHGEISTVFTEKLCSCVQCSMIKVQRIFLCCVSTQKILRQPHFLLFSVGLFACFCFFVVAKVMRSSVATQNEPLCFRTFHVDRTKVDDICLFTCVAFVLPGECFLLKHCTSLRTEVHYYTLKYLLHLPSWNWSQSDHRGSLELFVGRGVTH